jgi:hypothetical protein
LATAEKRRGPSIFVGARLPVKDKSKSRQSTREKKRRDTKMHASQFLHFPLKHPELLTQVLEEYEYSLLIRAHQQAQPDYKDVYRFPEQEWPQRAIDTVEAFRSVPGLDRHLEPLLRQVRWHDPYAIDIALCINQFLEWLRSNPNHIHFGPRLTGKTYGTIDKQSYLIRDSKIDDLVLIPKRDLTSEERRLLNAVRVAGTGELGLTAPEVIARCQQDPRLRELTRQFLAVEFKLGRPEDYGAVAKHHQRQTRNNTGLINSSLRQKGNHSRQDSLFEVKSSRLRPIVVGQLVYFGPNKTIASQHHAYQLRIGKNNLREAVDRVKIGHHLREHGNPIREQVEAARAQQEKHRKKLDRIIKKHFDSPKAWEMFAELSSPLEPTAEIIRKAHANQAISLDELIIVGGQIGIIWPSRDKALRIPLYDVPLDDLFPETNEDFTLIVRPDKPEILIVTETIDKEVVLSLPVVDAEGQETSSELVLQAMNMFLTFSPALKHEPFTFHEERFAVIKERLQTLQQRFHQNLTTAPETIKSRKVSRGERYAYLARRYLEKRGIPPEFAARHQAGCTVGWQEDLSACGLDGKEHLEDRLHLGISSGSIFLGEWPVLTAGLITIPLYSPEKVIQSGEEELIAFTSRAIFPKMEPSHRVAIPPLMKEHVIEEKIILGDLDSTDLILVSEGLFDTLTLRYVFELWGQPPYPCVIGNIGTAEMYFLEGLRQKYPDKLLLEAFDQDEAGREAGTQVIQAGGNSFRSCVEQIIPNVPEDIKDLNELFFFLRKSNCLFFLAALVEYTQAIARRYTELWHSSG